MKVQRAHLYQPVRFGQSVVTWLVANEKIKLEYTRGHLVIDTGDADTMFMVPPANIMYIHATREEIGRSINRSKPD
jgi:hypothetical protein